MGKGLRNRQKRVTALGEITRDQRRQLEKVIKKECSKYIPMLDDKYWHDVCCMVLLAVWRIFRPSKAKLFDFFCEFDEIHEAIRKRYEVDDPTTGAESRIILKDAGIDYDDFCRRAEERRLAKEAGQ